MGICKAINRNMDNDVTEIKDKLIAYANSLDTRKWSTLKDIFHKEATAEYGDDSIGIKFNSSSRDEIINMCQSNLNGCGFTQHLLGNFKIEINKNSATSQCYVRVYHIGQKPNEEEFYEMFGEYIDEWKNINNSWCIIHRKLKVNYERGNRDKVLAP